MIPRYPDWPARLDHFLVEARDREFAYGTHDCCLFVADAILAMTGHDIAAPFRGLYENQREALYLARRYSGAGSIRALIEKAFSDAEEVPVLQVQRGDIALLKCSAVFSLGLVPLSGREIVAASSEGFLRLPLNLVVRAWRV